jgi:hypothetical protein
MNTAGAVSSVWPEFGIYRVLTGDGLVEVGILTPLAGEISEAPVTNGLLSNAHSPSQRVKGHNVQTLAFGFRAVSQSRVHGGRDVVNGVLSLAGFVHALILCTVGTKRQRLRDSVHR